MLDDIVADIKLRLGLIDHSDYVRAISPERDTIINVYPEQFQDNIRALSDSMMDIRTAADVPRFFETKHKLEMQLEFAGNHLKSLSQAQTEDIELEKSTQFLGATDMLGYHPAGARLWKFFINPFGAFTFVCDNHWATRAAIRIIRTEIGEEGIKYIYARNVTPERLAQVDRQLKKLNIEQFRIEMATHANAYGNSWTLVEKNFMQEVINLRLMQADRMWPVFDKEGEDLLHWEYQVGRKAIKYEKNELLHWKDYCLKSRYLGLPPLAPAMSDIEADLSASALNNVIMQKAGMIGFIIALEDPTEKNPLNLKNVDKMTAKLQKTIQSQMSGIRGGQSVLVANYIKAIHKMSDIGGFEGNFMKLRAEIAKQVAILLQVPPERLAIPRTDSIQYQAASVEDLINGQFDKAINALTKSIDRFINEKILKQTLGIYDVEIASAGRFSSGNLNGARAAVLATQCGPLFDTNELRIYFFKVPALPPEDLRGRVVCDNSSLRDPALNKQQIAKVDPRDEVLFGDLTRDENEAQPTPAQQVAVNSPEARRPEVNSK